MRLLFLLAGCTALALSACATSPKKFYEDPTKPDDTSLCRAVVDQTLELKYRQDVAHELIRRGVSAEDCEAKVATQNAVVIGAAIVGLTTAAVIACSEGGCGGGGGGYAIDRDCYGGRGDNPVVHGPVWVGSYDPDRLDADKDGWGCEASDLSYGA